MPRSQNRKAKQDDGDTMVQCNKCRRWAYFEETSFKSEQDAAEAPGFVCLHCNNYETVQAKVAELEASLLALRSAVEHLGTGGVDLKQQLEHEDEESTCIAATSLPVENGHEHDALTEQGEEPRVFQAHTQLLRAHTRLHRRINATATKRHRRPPMPHDTGGVTHRAWMRVLTMKPRITCRERRARMLFA
ncbi:hypothetical protein MTO96_046657 [Rhipicephalus appendiculatus]